MAGLALLVIGGAVVLTTWLGPTGGRAAPAAARPTPVPPAWPPGADVRSFVGLVYPQPVPGDVYPAGVEHLGGGLVVDVTWKPGEPYSYTWAHVRRGSEELLWLQRLVPPGAAAGPGVEVVDAVTVGSVGEAYNFQVGGCRPGAGAGPPDMEIAAVVRSPADQAEIAAEQTGTGLADQPVVGRGDESPADLSSDVPIAWRLDRATGHIDAIPVTGLVCQTATD